MQFYYLTQQVQFAKLASEGKNASEEQMQTITTFIDSIFFEELGASIFQRVENKTLKSNTYSQLTLSGSLFSEVIFEDVIFEGCSFYNCQLDNCLFINCLFIDCKFQFTQFSGCNFEFSLWENCAWSLSQLESSCLSQSSLVNNVSYETRGLLNLTKNLKFDEFLELSLI